MNVELKQLLAKNYDVENAVDETRNPDSVYAQLLQLLQASESVRKAEHDSINTIDINPWNLRRILYEKYLGIDDRVLAKKFLKQASQLLEKLVVQHIHAFFRGYDDLYSQFQKYGVQPISMDKQQMVECFKNQGFEIPINSTEFDFISCLERIAYLHNSVVDALTKNIGPEFHDTANAEDVGNKLFLAYCKGHGMNTIQKPFGKVTAVFDIYPFSDVRLLCEDTRDFALLTDRVDEEHYVKANSLQINFEGSSMYELQNFQFGQTDVVLPLTVVKLSNSIKFVIPQGQNGLVIIPENNDPRKDIIAHEDAHRAFQTHQDDTSFTVSAENRQIKQTGHDFKFKSIEYQGRTKEDIESDLELYIANMLDTQLRVMRDETQARLVDRESSESILDTLSRDAYVHFSDSRLLAQQEYMQQALQPILESQQADYQSILSEYSTKYGIQFRKAKQEYEKTKKYYLEKVGQFNVVLAQATGRNEVEVRPELALLVRHTLPEEFFELTRLFRLGSKISISEIQENEKQKKIQEEKYKNLVQEFAGVAVICRDLYRDNDERINYLSTHGLDNIYGIFGEKTYQGNRIQCVAHRYQYIYTQYVELTQNSAADSTETDATVLKKSLAKLESLVLEMKEVQQELNNLFSEQKRADAEIDCAHLFSCEASISQVEIDAESYRIIREKYPEKPIINGYSIFFEKLSSAMLEYAIASNMIFDLKKRKFVTNNSEIEIDNTDPQNTSWKLVKKFAVVISLEQLEKFKSIMREPTYKFNETVVVDELELILNQSSDIKSKAEQYTRTTANQVDEALFFQLAIADQNKIATDVIKYYKLLEHASLVAAYLPDQQNPIIGQLLDSLIVLKKFSLQMYNLYYSQRQKNDATFQIFSFFGYRKRGSSNFKELVASQALIAQSNRDPDFNLEKAIIPSVLGRMTDVEELIKSEPDNFMTELEFMNRGLEDFYKNLPEGITINNLNECFSLFAVYQLMMQISGFAYPVNSLLFLEELTSTLVGDDTVEVYRQNSDSTYEKITNQDEKKAIINSNFQSIRDWQRSRMSDHEYLDMLNDSAVIRWQK